MVVLEPHAQTGAHDFDFLWGTWRIAHERLISRLTGSTEWEYFDADFTCWPILGGLGNVDDMRANWRGQDFDGSSLRLFDPATGLWSIYWVDSVGHTLQTPVVGKFENGVGAFFGDDQHNGQDVLVRFHWSTQSADAVRWEQAFSTDRGATWETNWIMRSTRQAGPPARNTEAR